MNWGNYWKNKKSNVDINIFNGRRVVFINRAGIRIAPTYKELKETIECLIVLHGKEEVYREIGLAIEVESNYDIYKGKKIVWDDDHDTRIFECIDIIERDYPEWFDSIEKIGERKGDLSVKLKWKVKNIPEEIEVRNDFWVVYEDLV